jgi:hypothetical protein
LTKSPSAAYTCIVWESNETVNLVVEPALTRLRASQPEEKFAGIVSKGAMVSVQVSGGRSLALKPGLNIVGGVQPRGPRDMFMLDISIICLFCCRVGCAVELGAADMVIDITSVVDDSSAISSIKAMSIDAADDAVDNSTVPEGGINIDILPSGAIDIGTVSEDAFDVDVESKDSMDIEIESSDPKHKSGPQSKIACGKHCTLPKPLASRLFTQCGYTPVRL